MHTSRTVLFLSVVSLLAAAGCDKKKEGEGGGAAKAVSGEKGGKGAKEGGLPAEVMAMVPAGAAKAWEGAWAGRLTLRTSGTMSMAGDPAAYEIKGDKAKVFTGKAEHELGFAIISPCEAEFTHTITEGDMKGGKQKIGKLFALQGDQVLVGSGSMGFRKGKAAVVCSEGMDGGVHVLDDKGTCTSYVEKFGEYTAKPTTCAWTQEEGKDVLTIGTGEWAPKVTAEGDVLMSGQAKQWMDEKLDVKVADYAAAKEAVLAKIKETDPLEIAKAAGGKVGETNTVPSLQATFLSDPAAWKGKPVELDAVYMNSNTSTSGDKSYFSAVVVESKDATKITLTCNTAAAVEGFTQWDAVTVKGTLDPDRDRPDLKDCTITKRAAK